MLTSINNVNANNITPPRTVVEVAATNMTSRLISDKEQVKTHDYYIEHLVDEILLPIVDHQYMAKRVLAKYWKKTSTEQRTTFTDAFKHKVIRTYAGAFKAFNGEEIEFQDPKFNDTGRKASVKSQIKRIGAPAINVTYLLYLKMDSWLTYDVVIEGVSLVKSFRDQFSQSIKRNGLSQAISILANEYKSEAPILKITGNYWEPYISNHLPANGLIINLVTSVFTRAGYQVDISYMPWNKISEGLKNSDLDASVASWYNETRAVELEFTDPYLHNELIIVKRSSDPLFFDSVDSLKRELEQKNYKLGAFKDFGYGDSFNEIAPYVSLSYYKYCTTMLRDLASDKIDLILVDRWIAEQELASNKNMASRLEIIPTTLIEKGLHVAISAKRNDSKEISAAFNRTLNKMKKDGSYTSILSQHNFTINKK